MTKDTHTGSVCIMLSDSVTYDRPHEWQRALQAELGGRCETPLHLTIDRTHPVATDAVPAIMDAIRHALADVRPIVLKATHRHAARSGYRSSWILKADAALPPAIPMLRTAVRSACEAAGTTCAYPVDLDTELVALTALVDVPAAPHLTPRAPLAEPISITLDTVHVSRILGRFEYEELARWGMAT